MQAQDDDCNFGELTQEQFDEYITNLNSKIGQFGSEDLLYFSRVDWTNMR